MCCSDAGFQDQEDINGECPECGSPTVDGQSFEYCEYSPEVCEECGWRPCDDSC